MRWGINRSFEAIYTMSLILNIRWAMCFTARLSAQSQFISSSKAFPMHYGKNIHQWRTRVPVMMIGKRPKSKVTALAASTNSANGGKKSGLETGEEVDIGVS